MPNTQPLKVVIYSPSFWPNVGGLEMVGRLLADGFGSRGHAVTVLTKTRSNSTEAKSDANIQFAYKVLRQPRLNQIFDEIAGADVVHCNGPSILLSAVALLKGKPVVWTHQNYRVSCVDGLGWLNGRPAPGQPFASALFHLRTRGLAALTGIVSMFLLRVMSKGVKANVAISRHMNERQPLPRQSVIYNPFDVRFRCSEEDARQQLQNAKYSFGFLGRLVSEKGCDVLLRALAICNGRRAADQHLSLVIIGDGVERKNLQELAEQLGILGDIKFAGGLTADDLLQTVRETENFVLPSVYEEPMGLVALELMSAGKPLIVSVSGGLSECAGCAAITFPNGDPASLAEAMESLSADATLQQQLISNGSKRSQEFGPDESVEQYLSLFVSILSPTQSIKSASQQ